VVNWYGHHVSKLIARTASEVHGSLEPVAGKSGESGFTGDGQKATEAKLNYPSDAAFDEQGRLYIADKSNDRVRRVTAGIIDTFAGGGTSLQENIPARQAAIVSPHSIAVDRSGNLFVSTGSLTGPLIRMVGLDEFINTVAGKGTGQDNGDGGPALRARFNSPEFLQFDRAGNLYVSEYVDRPDSGRGEDTYVQARLRKILADAPFFESLPGSLALEGFSGGPPITDDSTVLTAAVRNRYDPSVRLPIPWANLGKVPENISIPAVRFGATVTQGSAWLSVTPDSGPMPRRLGIIADPRGLPAGVHEGAVSVTMPDVDSASATIRVRFGVGASRPPQLSLGRDHFDFAFAENGAARTEMLVVSNSGGGDLRFSAQVRSAPGATWLAVSPEGGTARPGTPVNLGVRADPRDLKAGVYTAGITISTDAGTENVPVVMTVTSGQRVLLLTQSGLSFVAVKDGGVVPPQSFGVLNQGRGTMEWITQTETSGGTWLRVTDRGVSTAGAEAPSAQVDIDVSRLPQEPGDYTGMVIVNAGDAANRSQVLTTFLRVLPKGSNPGAVVEPSDLVFTTAAGEAPGSRDVLVYNIAAQAQSFRATLSANFPAAVQPTEGSLDPGRPTRITVQPWTHEPGEHTGVLHIYSDGRAQEVRLRLVVTGDNRRASKEPRAAEASCTMKPALTSQTLLSSTPAGWPVAVQVLVSDGCNNVMQHGSVNVQFDNGDEVLKLQSLNNGVWQGTWRTREIAANKPVTAKVTAVTPEGQEIVSQSYRLNLGDRAERPRVSWEDIVSEASLASSPLAPGSRILLSGTGLASGRYTAGEEHADELGDALKTRVYITGVLKPGAAPLTPLKLERVDTDQIAAVVPEDIATGLPHQILVKRDEARSVPVLVAAAEAQPAVYRVSDAGRQGNIRLPDGRLATQDAPAPVGSTVVLRCAGLGRTSPPLAAGKRARGDEKVLAEVKVTIGGKDAALVQPASLIENLVNMYEVRVQVPFDVVPTDEVEVTLTVADQTSPAVTMAVAPAAP
jgi:uncharacterized protein (TIGR03437 family)